MNNFSKGSSRKSSRSSSGYSKFGGKFGGGRDKNSRHTELFPATCSKCGKSCQVPFRPTGSKPVYCSDCFSKQDHAPAKDVSRGDYKDKGPRQDTPAQRVYRTEYPRTPSDGGIGELKKQLTSLELKVTRILELISKKRADLD